MKHGKDTLCFLQCRTVVLMMRGTLLHQLFCKCCAEQKLRKNTQVAHKVSNEHRLIGFFFYFLLLECCVVKQLFKNKCGLLADRRQAESRACWGILFQFTWRINILFIGWVHWQIIFWLLPMSNLLYIHDDGPSINLFTRQLRMFSLKQLARGLLSYLISGGEGR